MTKGLSLPLLIAAALIAAAAPAAVATEIKTERGRLQELIARLASSDYVLGEPGSDPRPYVDPTPVLHAFRHLAAALAWGDVHDAALEAAKFDYEVVIFVDAQTRNDYYVLREDLSQGQASRGWGSYIFNPTGRINAVVEVPHPLADAQTPEIGGAVFELAGARGYLLAGAHRLKADVPDLVDSIFHQVHTAWIGPAANVAAWQIHGFASAKHAFPDGAHVIASSGDGAIVPEVAMLDAKFESEGLATYVFNQTPPRSPANQQLNGDVPGVTFRSLAATANEQGRHSRSLGGAFVHVELESRLRLDSQQASRAATVIAAAMSEAPAARLAARTAASDPQVRTASYTPQAEQQSAGPAAAEGEVEAEAEKVVAVAPAEHPAAVEEQAPPLAPEVAPETAAQPSQSLNVARGTSQPERADGSRPRRMRKRTS
jgi:hypothetical protein